MGNNEAAMADFDKVLELQPSNSHALFRRGFLWKRNKKYDEAAQVRELSFVSRTKV
jgi:tetratricopeptide (TPR) repeat protein